MAQLTNENYFELWKYFSEDTAKIKDKLWTISSWFYTLMSGLMTFEVKYIIDKGLPDKRMVCFLSFTGLLMSVYTCFMIREYGRHITTGWNTSEFLRDKIEGLKELLASNSNGASNNSDEATGFLKWLKEHPYKNKLPPFVIRLDLLSVLYGIAFVGIMLYTVFKS